MMRHDQKAIKAFIGKTVAASIASIRRAAAHYQRLGEKHPLEQDRYFAKAQAYKCAAGAEAETARRIAAAIRSKVSLEGRFIRMENHYEDY